MHPPTVFTLGALFTLTNAAEALISSSRPSNISWSASVHNSPASTSSSGAAVTSFSSTASWVPDAAALLSTTYLTEFNGGEWNPYGPDPFGFPNNAPASINSYCSSLFVSSSSHYSSTVALTSTTVAPYTLSAAATTELVREEVYVYNQGRFSYSPSAPCCLNCTLFGGTVQVYYWPTPAPSPPVTKLVNAANFTFTSPSIYVAFQSLHATDLCGQVGQAYSSTTLAFPPGELSTAAEYFLGSPYYITDANNHSTLTTDTFIPPPYENFTLADFGAVKSCADITTTAEYNNGLFSFDDAMGGDGTMTVTMTYNPCSPKVSMPTELFTINSMWTSCLKGIDGFFDPPYTLTPGNGLSAFSTMDPVTPAPETQATPTSTAVAGSTPSPITPIQTASETPSIAPASTPSIDPPASTSSNDPPAPSPTLPKDPATPNPTAPPSDNSPSPSPSTVNDPSTASPDPPAPVSSNNSPAQPPTTASDPLVNPATTTPAPSPVVIASQTLAPGSQITYSSTTYSLASNGASLVIANSQGTTTQILATPPPSPSPSSYVVIGTQTVSAGSSAVVVSGMTYSLVPSANVLVVDGTSQYLIGSQTLVPGGAAITISGTVASLLAGGSSVVIGGSTLTLSALIGSGPMTTSEVEYIIGSQTLSVGGVATVSISGSAVQVSLLAGGSSVVIGGTTTVPASVLISDGAKSTEVLVTETGLGGIIASLGGFATSSAGATNTNTSPSPYVLVPGESGVPAFNGTIFTGGASSICRREDTLWIAWWGLLLGLGTIGVVLL